MTDSLPSVSVTYFTWQCVYFLIASAILTVDQCLVVVFIVGDSVQEQQNLLRKCYTELEGFSKFLTAMAALKYGNFALCF